MQYLLHFNVFISVIFFMIFYLLLSFILLLDSVTGSRKQKLLLSKIQAVALKSLLKKKLLKVYSFFQV